LDELTDDVDIVFHQAAVVSVEKSVEEPESCHEVNTDATLHLLELAREKDFRLVLASSAAIYGEPETIPISEADSKTPTSPYGIDKWTIDRYAQVYNDLYDTETVALRYFNIYGPRHVSAGATTVASSASSGTKRSLENRLPSTATARRREISSTSTTSSRPTC